MTSNKNHVWFRNSNRSTDFPSINKYAVSRPLVTYNICTLVLYNSGMLSWNSRIINYYIANILISPQNNDILWFKFAKNAIRINRFFLGWKFSDWRSWLRDCWVQSCWRIYGRNSYSTASCIFSWTGNRTNLRYYRINKLRALSCTRSSWKLLDVDVDR